MKQAASMEQRRGGPMTNDAIQNVVLGGGEAGNYIAWELWMLRMCFVSSRSASVRWLGGRTHHA